MRVQECPGRFAGLQEGLLGGHMEFPHAGQAPGQRFGQPSAAEPLPTAEWGTHQVQSDGLDGLRQDAQGLRWLCEDVRRLSAFTGADAEKRSKGCLCQGTLPPLRLHIAALGRVHVQAVCTFSVSEVALAASLHGRRDFVGKRFIEDVPSSVLTCTPERDLRGAPRFRSRVAARACFSCDRRGSLVVGYLGPGHGTMCTATCLRSRQGCDKVAAAHLKRHP